MTTTRIALESLSSQLPSQRERQRQQPKGRRVESAVADKVESLLASHAGGLPPRRGLLIEYLHQLHDHFGQLGTPQLAALARWMGLAQTEVFEVASFYHHFELVREDAQTGALPAPPALTVRVCDGLACELAGAGALHARLQALLPATVRVVAAPCVGRCEQAPVAVVGQRPVVYASAEQVQAAVTQGEVWDDPPAGALDLSAYQAGGGYRLLADCLSGARSLDSVLATLDDAGLRGLGGAGFPSGRKWRLVRAEPGPRLMAVNIDEGEPGTFKDRFHLEQDPHRFLEGMLIAAWAVEAEGVYIYLRDEYHGLRALLQRELAALPAALAAAGLPVGQLPRLELRRGAGAYICGEESAMLESIEGKRGLPRLRPPYVAQRGLFGRPTLVHNLETLHWVRDILEKGPAWFASSGRHGRKGLRSFSVSGRVKDPGVKVAPAGITLHELIDEFCGGMADGHTLYAYLPGGASGGILPARLADLPLDFDTLQPYGCFIGSAAVVVLSQHDRARDAALNAMRFFADESCGQCTPCRVGTVKAVALMQAPVWDQATLNDLSTVMVDASICGLGQAAPNPVRCVQQYFAHEIGG